MKIKKLRRIKAGHYEVGSYTVEKDPRGFWWVTTYGKMVYPPECYREDSFKNARALALVKANAEYIKKEPQMKKDIHVESYDGFDIHETPEGKYYAIILFSGAKSKEFDTLLALQNYYKL